MWSEPPGPKAGKAVRLQHTNAMSTAWFTRRKMTGATGVFHACCREGAPFQDHKTQGKLAFWADSKMLAFVPRTSWRWWDLLIWGSLLKETTAGEALDSSSLLPCIFLHPYIEPGPGSIAEKEKMDLDPAEGICCHFVTQHKYKVLDAPMESPAFCWKEQTPAFWIWHLTTGQQNRMWIPGRWTGFVHWSGTGIAHNHFSPSWLQTTAQQGVNPFFSVPTSSFFQSTNCCTWTVSPKHVKDAGFRRWSNNNCFVILQLKVLPYSGKAVQNTGD